MLASQVVLAYSSRSYFDSHSHAEWLRSILSIEIQALAINFQYRENPLVEFIHVYRSSLLTGVNSFGVDGFKTVQRDYLPCLYYYLTLVGVHGLMQDDFFDSNWYV